MTKKQEKKENVSKRDKKTPPQENLREVLHNHPI